MSIKTALTLAVLSFCGPSGSIYAEDATTAVRPAGKEIEALQGAWEGAEIGREAAGKCKITITGNSIHFQGPDENEWYKGTFTVSSDTQPKQLRATITECAQPSYVGKTSLAIFQLEQGRLSLAGSEPGASEAPKTFKGDKGARNFVFTKAQR